MKRTTKNRVVLLLSALMLLASLSACGEKAETAAPMETSASAQAEPADMPAPTQAAESGQAPCGSYTATRMISRGEPMDIEPVHLTVNEDGSGLMSDSSGSYSVTFYFDEGTGIITERQSYFTFSLDGDTLILVDGRGAETVFEPDD